MKPIIKRIIFIPEFVVCLFITLFLLSAIYQGILFIFEDVAYVSLVIFFAVFTVLYVIFAWKKRLQWVTLDEVGIKIRSPLFRGYKVAWQEVESVQLVQYGYIFKRLMFLVKKRREDEQTNGELDEIAATLTKGKEKELYAYVPCTIEIEERIKSSCTAFIGDSSKE